MPRPIKTTCDARCSSAEICRRNDWGAGTWLQSRCKTPWRIRITAVGADEVLAVQTFPVRSGETLWDLRLRDWYAV